MFGKPEFDSWEEYQNIVKKYENLENENSELTKDYNNLIKKYNELLRISKLDANKNDKLTSELISKGTELQKVVDQLTQENKELAEELKIAQSKQLNDYELEIKNATTLEEVEALKAKHKEIMHHRKMRRMVQARGQKHDY